MIIKEKCHKCNGDGWTVEPIEYLEGYEWEQVQCNECCGQGYVEIDSGNPRGLQ